MTPPGPAALLIACTYERSPFRPLRWAAADAVALARALVRHCGFERVVVLHRRPSPFFTEGELGSREAILDFARQLVPKSTDSPHPLAEDISDHLRRPHKGAPAGTVDEVIDLTQLMAKDPTPEEFDSLESLVVAVLNRWLGHHASKSPPPTDELLRKRRQEFNDAFPDLAKPSAADTPLLAEGIEFRGVPTASAIVKAIIELDRTPDTDQPAPLLFTALCGHGMHYRGRNCFLLPDSHNRFLDLTSLPIENLVRWSGSQALFIDACQVPFDAARSTKPGSQATSVHGISARDHVGLPGKPIETTGWTLSTPAAPSQGTIAFLHTCWPDRPALEFDLWRQGVGTRCFLEALRSTGWRAETDPDTSTGSGWKLTFEEVARQVYREVRQSTWTLARGQANDSVLQDPHLLRAGIPEDLVLARQPQAPPTHRQDPRLWIHPPRLDDIHASQPFRTSLGIPFVHLRQNKSLIACWPVRNRDFAHFLQANPGSQAPHTDAGANPDWPRTQVTLADAIAFCDWLTKRDIASGILPPVGFQYDLPTDGERDFSVGLPPQDRPPCQIQFTVCCPWQEPTPPEGFCYGSKGPIPVDAAALLDTQHRHAIPGLRGLAGNVWEMTKTPYKPNQGAGDDFEMTVRGQSFRTPIAEADLARRESRFAVLRLADVGFRVVLRRGP
jgi:hypothetical protein